MAYSVPSGAVVPLVPLTPAVRDLATAWISTHIPDWDGMPILSAGKYLGTYLGPVACDLIWPKAASKWDARAMDIAKSGSPVSYAVLNYNKFAFSALSYLMQLYLPPQPLVRHELHVISRILHMADAN